MEQAVNVNLKQTSSLSLWRPWLIWGAAATFYLYEYALRASPSVMTHELMVDLDVTSTILGVLTSFYYYAYVPLQIPCGVIVDRFGPRRVVTASAVLCVVGAFLFAESHSLIMAQIGRFLLGMGSACAYLSCAKIGAEWFSHSRFAMIAGLTMMMGTLGGTFGGRPVAMLVNAYSWRTTMLILALIGVAVTIVSWIIIRDKPENSLTDNYSISQEAGLLEGLKEVISNPQIWLLGLYGCMMYIPLSGFAELWGVPYIMQTYNVNNEVAAMASIMVFVGMGLGSFLSAWLSDYLKSRRLVMSWAALGSLFFFLIAIYVPGIPLNGVLAMLFLMGLACGGQILYFAVAREETSHHISGTVVGFTNGLLMSSGVIFQPLLGGVLDWVWDGQMTSTGIRFYSAGVYKYAMAVIPISLLIAWIVMQFIKETYPAKGSNTLEACA